MARISRLANVEIQPASTGDDDFLIDRQSLWKILNIALQNTDFDSSYYISSNEDVRKGIASGVIKSAFDHYVEFGFMEGRRGWKIQVDERFYLKTYEDVRKPIADGQFKNGQEHFDILGESEGRSPYSGFKFFRTGKASGQGLFAVLGKTRRA